MIKVYLSDRSGITLIEVLATLLILSLVGGLTFGLLTTTVKQNTHSQDHINLRQEANIIVSTLRQNLHNEETSNVCYDDLFYLENIYSENFHLNDKILNPGNCLPVDQDTNLHVKFTLNDSSNHSFAIDTIIEKKYATETTLVSIDLPSPGDPEDPDDPSPISQSCNIYTNNKNWSDIARASFNISDNKLVIFVQGDLHVDEDINLTGYDSVEIYIAGDLSIEHGKKIENSTLYVQGDYDHKNGGHVRSSAKVHVANKHQTGPGNSSQGTENVLTSDDKGYIEYTDPECNNNDNQDASNSVEEISFNPDHFVSKDLPANQCEYTGNI